MEVNYICLGFNDDKVAKLKVVDGVLELPDTIEGRRVYEWYALSDYYCGHFNAKDKVRKIIINGDYTVKLMYFLGDFPNLEILEVTGNIDWTKSGVDQCKKLKRLVIPQSYPNTMLSWQLCWCPNIEEIQIRGRKVCYIMEEFKNHQKLKPNWLLHEGLQVIFNRAFYGCSAFVDVNLPKTLRRLGTQAFFRCSNIKTLRINSFVILEGSYTQHIVQEFLKDSPNAVVYCPQDYPINYLKRYLYPTVRVVEQGKILMHSSRTIGENLLKKIRLLGLKKCIRDVPTTPEDLIKVLELIDEDEWNRQLINEVASAVETGLKSNRRMIGDGLFFVKLYIEKRFDVTDLEYYKRIIAEEDAYELMNKFIEFKGAKIDGDFCRLMYKEKYGKDFEIVFLINKNKIIEELKNGIKPNYKVHASYTVSDGYQEVDLALSLYRDI